MKRAMLFGLTLLPIAACKPDLGSPASFIAGPRILGIRTEPPEVSPGMPTMAELLAVDATGRVLPDATWALCEAPKPPSENNVVAHGCVVPEPGDAGAVVPVMAHGPSVSITIPGNACAINGPDTPPTKPGEPPLRPRDPDITGGYYQPVSVQLPGAGDAGLGFVLERIGCNLPNVSLDVVQAFQKRYQVNVNPVLSDLKIGGVVAPPVVNGAATGALTVPANGLVDLEAGWTAASRETFPVYDIASRAIVDHTEELTVSWFATGGAFDRDRSGRSETEVELTAANSWRAPIASGPVHLWLVLRDNRGGLDFREYLIVVN